MKKEIEACHQAVGVRIRMVRESLGLTQLDLAGRTVLSRGTIANIETGRERLLLNTVETVAQALGTTPKHLLRGVWW